METIHEYGVDGLAVSSAKEKVKLGVESVTLHHTVRSGQRQLYWFSMFHKDTGYLDFDVRDCWEHIGLEEPCRWVIVPDVVRLKMLAYLATEFKKDAGGCFVEFVKKQSITLTLGNSNQSASLERLVKWHVPSGEVPDGGLIVEVDTNSGSEVKIVYIDDDCRTLIEPDSGDVWTICEWDGVSRYARLEDVLPAI